MFLFCRDGRSSASLTDCIAGADVELDVDVIASRLLMLSPLRLQATPYRGVSAVGRPRVPFRAARRVERVERAPAELLAGLSGAVDRALEGVSRVAVMTGGGTDSSALLALACDWARRTGKSAFGVSLDFGGRGDDRPHLAVLESHLACEVLRVSPEEAAGRFALFTRGVDSSPFTWPGGAMEVELLARARAHGADCVLSGVGADELLDGDPRALAGIVTKRGLRAAIRAARALKGFESPRFPWVDWVARPVAARLLPRSLRRVRARRNLAAAPTWAGPRAHDFHSRWMADALESTLRWRRDPVARYEAHQDQPHHEHLFWLRHQEQLAAGIERRDPYLDPELVANVMSFPEEWLLHGNVRRGLFREALRGLVPSSILERLDKAEFEQAFVRFLRAVGGFETLRPLATVECLADLGLALPRPFRESFDAFASSPETSYEWGGVWPALAVESFLRSRTDTKVRHATH